MAHPGHPLPLPRGRARRCAYLALHHRVPNPSPISPHRNGSAQLLAHLDRAPFIVRACAAGDIPQLLGLQAACGCSLQGVPLDAPALAAVLEAQAVSPERLTWVAEVGRGS